MPLGLPFVLPFPVTREDCVTLLDKIKAALWEVTSACFDFPSRFPLVTEVNIPSNSRIELVTAHGTESLACYILGLAVLFHKYGAKTVDVYWVSRTVNAQTKILRFGESSEKHCDHKLVLNALDKMVMGVNAPSLPEIEKLLPSASKSLLTT